MRRTYRVGWERWLNVAISGALTLFLWFTADDGRSGSGSAAQQARLIGVVLVFAGCVLVVRSIRIAVVTTPDTVIVRGIFTTR